MRHFVIGSLMFFSTAFCAAEEHKPAAIEPLMVSVPAGQYLMGSNENPSEQPIHKVTIRPFRLAKYPVTIKEFSQFTEATNYQATGKCLNKLQDGKPGELDIRPLEKAAQIFGEYVPITCVSWVEVQAYITWLNQQTGKHYRVPSEAEWEYAARSGSDARFHFGNDEQQLCDYGNGYDQNLYLFFGRDLKWPGNPLACYDGETWPNTVGIYKPNKFGLYDMQGNVTQWVADCYHPNYQSAPTRGEPRQGENCIHFARNGSWLTPADHLRSRYRPAAAEMAGVINSNPEQMRFADRGFRLALDEAMNGIESSNKVQKDFLVGLQNAQMIAQERNTAARKEFQALLDKYKSLRTTPVITPPMVTIPGGEFLMGSNIANNEKPIHNVNVKPFRISKYEVTVKQFKQFAAATGYMTDNNCWKFVGENGGRFKTGYDMAAGNWLTTDYAPSDFHPVMCISWDDANAYLSWLSQQTGRKFRLPTEAEWEYAARAGTTTRFFFGDDENKLCEYANIFDKSGMRAFVRDKGYQPKEKMCDDHAEYTSIVGMYKPNAFGLHDVIGNVSEWVEDCDHPNFKGAPTDGSAWLAEDCSMRTRRGNSYGMTNDSQVSMRGHGGQTNRSALGEGFRIAEDIEPESTDKNGTEEINAFEIELKKRTTSRASQTKIMTRSEE